MAEFLKSLWRSVTKPSADTAAVPDNTRLYIIGDIHGRLDLLAKMHELIWQDMQKFPIGITTEVYIGDYIDRGPDAAGVIEILCASRPLCNQRVCLMGNHEQIFLDFLANPETITSWMELGGLETLSSYGLRPKLSFSVNEVRELHPDFLSDYQQHMIGFFDSFRTVIPAAVTSWCMLVCGQALASLTKKRMIFCGFAIHF